MLLVSLITAYTLIYDIIRYCSKKIVFDLQHFSVKICIVISTIGIKHVYNTSVSAIYFYLRISLPLLKKQKELSGKNSNNDGK